MSKLGTTTNTNSEKIAQNDQNLKTEKGTVSLHGLIF